MHAFVRLCIKIFPDEISKSSSNLTGTVDEVDLVPGRLHLPHDPEHVPVGQLGEILLRPVERGVLKERGEEVGVLRRVLQALGEPLGRQGGNSIDKFCARVSAPVCARDPFLKRPPI